MEKLELSEEERWVLFQLNKKPSANQNVFEILKRGGFNFSDKSTENLLDDLKKVGLAGGNEPMLGRVTIEGRKYLKEFEEQFKEFEIAEGLESTEEHVKSLKEELSTDALEENKSLKKEKFVDEAFSDPGKYNVVEPRHALSNSEKDEKLISQGYELQGLIGYVLENEKQGSDPVSPLIALEQEEYELGKYMPGFNFELLDRGVGIQLAPQLLGFIPQEGDEIPIHVFRRQLQFGEVDYMVCSSPLLDELKGYGYEEDLEAYFPAFLWESQGEDRIPLYVYSTQSEIQLFDPLPEPEEASNKETDAEFLHDNPSTIDELGRKAIINVIHTKLEKLWPKLGSQEPYTLLLNGEWGSGKSSMLYYFKETLEASKWEVIEYNAWKHQHLENQWWILVNKVSEQLTPFIPVPLFNSHWWWSCWLKNRNTILFLILIGVCYVLNRVYNPFSISQDSITLYDGIFAIMGTLVVWVNSLIQSVFNKTITTSELARKFTADPYKPIQDRFDKVTHKKKVAIFIDDLDRCEIKSTVDLLEGIQNLFKQSKVLYVIAADGNWVSNCFDDQYEKFEKLSRKGHSIGNQFLQKSFQMIVDVPKMDEEQHQKIWSKYLGIEPDAEETVTLEEEQITTTKIQSAETTEELKSALEGSTTMEQREVAAERFGELVENKKDHVLADFTDYVPKNPRMMKRLVNQYIIKSQSLIISRTQDKVSDEALVRYIIFDATFPNFCNQVRNGNTNLEDLKKEHEEVRNLVGEELTTELVLDVL